MTGQAGLCQTCAFSRMVESARGSRFLLCRLSEKDARFAKYPRLPVLRCPGYRRATRGDQRTGKVEERR